MMRERSKNMFEVAPYFLAKLAAELPISAVFPAAFAAMVYPVTGLNPKLRRFATFLGIVTLEAFASASLGLAVGSVAPSTDAALALGPVVMVRTSTHCPPSGAANPGVAHRLRVLKRDSPVPTAGVDRVRRAVHERGERAQVPKRPAQVQPHQAGV